MSRFNLVEEKWIPVRYSDGKHDELGIHDTLLHSQDIAAIEDPSPLVVAALHRFLLAVLYRALEGPADFGQAKVLFREGIPGQKTINYLEKWRDRFWLFDDEHPFYQVREYEPKGDRGIQKWRSWTAIASEHNADNAKVLFDHTPAHATEAIPTGKAARWIFSIQTFALGGGKSDFCYTKGAPSATSVIVLPLGKNLHDTLLLSLVPENKEILESDIPIWEQEPIPLASIKQGFGRPIFGNADLYTWLSRSIKLRFEKDGRTVSGVAFASGIPCNSTNYIDPMLAYEIDDKRGKQAVRFRERGLWRDFDSLLPDESYLAPKVIEYATRLARFHPDRFPRSVLVLGQANDQAKIEYWRMERFELPEALRGDRFIRTAIRQLLNEAEVAQKALWQACRSFARSRLTRGERDPDRNDVKEFINQMEASARYWSILETRFHEILVAYTVERDSEDIRCQWLKFVRDALWTAWEELRTSASRGDAWAIRALVKAEAPVRRKLKELKDEIRKLEPREERV